MMKQTIKLLNRIARIVDMDDFYSINIRDDGYISLQGFPTSGKIAKYNKLIELSMDAGYGKISGSRKNNNFEIRIVLY